MHILWQLYPPPLGVKNKCKHFFPLENISKFELQIWQPIIHLRLNSNNFTYGQFLDMHQNILTSFRFSIAKKKKKMLQKKIKKLTATVTRKIPFAQSSSYIIFTLKQISYKLRNAYLVRTDLSLTVWSRWGSLVVSPSKTRSKNQNKVSSSLKESKIS